MDCQGLVVRLLQDFVLLTTAVEVAQRWRELAEKLAKVSKQQMDAYESPHRDRNGVVDSEVSGAARRDARGGGGRPLLPGVGGRETRSDAAKAAPPGAGGDAGSGASLRSGAPHGEGAGGGASLCGRLCSGAPSPSLASGGRVKLPDAQEPQRGEGPGVPEEVAEGRDGCCPLSARPKRVVPRDARGAEALPLFLWVRFAPERRA